MTTLQDGHLMAKGKREDPWKLREEVG